MKLRPLVFSAASAVARGDGRRADHPDVHLRQARRGEGRCRACPPASSTVAAASSRRRVEGAGQRGLPDDLRERPDDRGFGRRERLAQGRKQQADLRRGRGLRAVERGHAGDRDGHDGHAGHEHHHRNRPDEHRDQQQLVHQGALRSLLHAQQLGLRQRAGGGRRGRGQELLRRWPDRLQPPGLQERDAPARRRARIRPLVRTVRAEPGADARSGDRSLGAHLRRRNV